MAKQVDVNTPGPRAPALGKFAEVVEGEDDGEEDMREEEDVGEEEDVIVVVILLGELVRTLGAF